MRRCGWLHRRPLAARRLQRSGAVRVAGRRERVVRGCLRGGVAEFPGGVRGVGSGSARRSPAGSDLRTASRERRSRRPGAGAVRLAHATRRCSGPARMGMGPVRGAGGSPSVSGWEIQPAAAPCESRTAAPRSHLGVRRLRAPAPVVGVVQGSSHPVCGLSSTIRCTALPRRRPSGPFTTGSTAFPRTGRRPTWRSPRRRSG